MMLAPAFDDPALASQAAFRTVMEAMARPGRARALPSRLAAPPPLGATAAAVALTLLDYETPFWLDQALAAAPEVAAWLRFHTGAPLALDSMRATFAFVSDPLAMPPFAAFAPGTLEYPDRSTTLVLQVVRFGAGDALALSGPGIQETTNFSAQPLPPDFRARLIANREGFPRGVDLILVSPDAVAALPRSVRVAS
jgi:alpha-D-ribose 1-methylphosphonate 5-triphosphate synthase subunit PhnH